MRLGVLLALSTLILSVWSCESNQYQNGCKISGASCTCSYGCKTEYIYKTKKACRNALKEASVVAPPPSPKRSSNICSSMPCSPGICIQTTNEIGFTCKCDNTGFYGQRCEKACPIGPTRGMVFPHECVII